MHTQREQETVRAVCVRLQSSVGVEPLITANDKMMAKIARYASANSQKEDEEEKKSEKFEKKR